jgi:hypothetical protein
LHGGQKQSEQDADDSDDDQQLNEGKRGAASREVRNGAPPFRSSLFSSSTIILSNCSVVVLSSLMVASHGMH